MCFNIYIYDNELISSSEKQFRVLFNITDDTLAVPGVNHTATVTILDDDEKRPITPTEGKKSGCFRKDVYIYI